MEWFKRLKDGLKKSSSKLGEGLTNVFTKHKIDAETLDELEELLLSADMGYPATSAVIEQFSKQKFDKEASADEIKVSLSAIIASQLSVCEKPFVLGAHQPEVVLMVGVNGAGKTTTIGKLAQKFKGKKMTFVAADTFRAAAVEQLKVWAERTGAHFVFGANGCDAAGLCFDALKAAVQRGDELVFIDTAGRLQNKTNLVEELQKIVRVIKKVIPEAPHHTLLCLDAATGQNALEQVKIFKETAAVDGLIINKLDGTSKAGVLVAIAKECPLPVYFIGVGEQLDDLNKFEADAFAKAMLDL